MDFSNEFWMQIVSYAISFSSFGSVTLWRLNKLEKKQDVHNSLITRMVEVETKLTNLEKYKEMMK